MVHAPAIVKLMIQRDRDHLPGRRDRAARRLQRARQIDPVEAQDDIGGGDGLPRLLRQERRRCAEMQRMVGGKYRGAFEIGHHAGAQRLRQRHAIGPFPLAVRAAPHQDHRLLRRAQHRHRARHLLRRHRRHHIGHKSGNIDRRQRIGDRRLLHAGVEIDVDRRLGCRIGQPIRAQQRLPRRLGRGRLIVPLGVVADQRALIARGMDPVDPRPALRRIHRAGRAEQQHRHAVAPGVEHGHRRMHQPDIGVHRGGHRPSGHLGVAVSDRHGVLLVQAQQHLRLHVAEVVHQAVVQAAVAGAGVQRDERNLQRTQRLGHDIAAEQRVARGQRQRPFDRCAGAIGKRGRVVSHPQDPCSSPSHCCAA